METTGVISLSPFLGGISFFRYFHSSIPLKSGISLRLLNPPTWRKATWELDRDFRMEIRRVKRLPRGTSRVARPPSFSFLFFHQTSKRSFHRGTQRRRFLAAARVSYVAAILQANISLRRAFDEAAPYGRPSGGICAHIFYPDSVGRHIAVGQRFKII